MASTSKMTTAALVLAAAIGILSAPSARADGIADCTESHDKLQAEAAKAIDMIGEKVPLGPYETASTVLPFVNASLKGVDTPMPCADIWPCT
jgi:hypothetical protein